MSQFEIQYRQRRDQAADWTTNNPVLGEGQIGFECDTGYLKMGDGVTAWTSLPYYHGPPWFTIFDGGAPDSTFLGVPFNPNGLMCTKPPAVQIDTTIIANTTFGNPPSDITTDGNGNWVVVASSGSNVRIWYSDDGGLTWNETASVINVQTAVNSVAYQNGVWIAMGLGFDVILRSVDNGVTWTEIQDNPNTNANGVTEVQGDDGIGLFMTDGSNQSIVDADGLLPWSQNSNGSTFLPNQFIFVGSTAYIYGDSGANNPRNGFTTNGSSYTMNNDMPTSGNFNGRPDGPGDYDGTNFVLVANDATGGGATDNSFRYWYSPTFAAPWNADLDNRYDTGKQDKILILKYIPAQELWYIITEIGEVYTSSDPTTGSSGWTQVTTGNLPGNIPGSLTPYRKVAIGSDAWTFINNSNELVVNTFV